MDTHELDSKLITAVFSQAGLVGWQDVSLVEAAREAGLDVGDVRVRFPGKTAVALRFGAMADQAVLRAAPEAGTPREKLFDLLMARFDVLQQHRAGVLALMQTLRFDPGLTLLLGGATLRSMRWLLEAADIPARGVVGTLRANGLAVVWAYALRAWEKDDSQDMGPVMAAVDRGLDRAMQAEAILPGNRAMAADQAAPTHPAPPILTAPEILDADDGPAVL